MSAAPGFSVKQQCAKRIISEMVEKVPGFKIMCVDQMAMKVVGSCLKVSDVTDLGIAVIEPITNEREPLTDLECIYFVEPCVSSWERIRDDFADKKSPQYKKAHLFFTSKVPDSLFAQIKQQPNLLSRLGSFIELNMEFLCLESQVFSLNMQDSFLKLGPSMLSTVGIPLDAERDERNHITQLANRLFTFCGSMDEFPNIRYQTGPSGVVATKVATALNEMMTQNKAATPESPAAGSSTILILDRTHDPLATLLHEFFVQGCAVDMLKMEDNKYTHRGTATLLNQEDQVWTDMCHVFIGAAQETVDKRKAELEQRPAYKMMQAQKSGEPMDVKGMSDVVKDLPKFKKEYERCLICVDVLMKMMGEAQKFIAAVEVEQSLAVERIDKARQEEFRNLLNDQGQEQPLNEINKLRMIILYALTQFNDKRKMPDDLRTNLMDMAGLGDPLFKNALEAAELLSKDYNENYFVAARKGVKRRPSADDLTLARYVPIVKDAAKALLDGSLPEAQYPFMRQADKPPATSGGKAGGGGAGASARGGRAAGGRAAPRWANKKAGGGGGGGGGAAGGGTGEKIPKVFIFVVGGITYSEIRACYEATKEQKNGGTGVGEMPVVIGSTSVLHPSISYDASGNKMGGAAMGCPEFIRYLMDVWTPGS
jgi:syntaxin-binding protein 1